MLLNFVNLSNFLVGWSCQGPLTKDIKLKTRRRLTKTFDGHETTDDELSDNYDVNENIIQTANIA